MEHKKTNKRYNKDFKRTVVDLYHSGYSVKELSSEYGISEVTIYKWIKEFTPLGEAGQSIAYGWRSNQHVPMGQLSRQCLD
ncbi:hypothetical protein E1B06_04680 [Brevibacillus laterosporus]|nr:hypothetical protein [Brevibacillus laterosporus]